MNPIIIQRPLGDDPPTATLYYGRDCRETLRSLEAESINCIVTSPPYWGLRDYGVDGQLGLEEKVDDFVQNLVGVFREAHRVLRDDGTCWLNLGDSFFGGGYANHAVNGETWLKDHGGDRRRSRQQDRIRSNPGIKPKDLVGVPWRVAFALQADGWYLRSDIIWAKGSCMPESVRDRPTRAHEYIFLLTKQPRYYYDADEIRVYPNTPIDGRGSTAERKAAGHPTRYGNTTTRGSKSDGNGWSMPSISAPEKGRNKRTVWNVNPKPYSGAHFAVFPPKLVEPCILAGCPRGGTVLDPFSGSGTTGEVALDHGRNYVGLDLNAGYLDLAKARILGEKAPAKQTTNRDEDGPNILDYFQ